MFYFHIRTKTRYCRPKIDTLNPKIGLKGISPNSVEAEEEIRVLSGEKCSTISVATLTQRNFFYFFSNGFHCYWLWKPLIHRYKKLVLVVVDFHCSSLGSGGCISAPNLIQTACLPTWRFSQLFR